MIDVPLQKLRNRVFGFYGFLGCFNLGAWIWAFLAFHDKPVLIGTAFLAYTFGLRHAVDADHIAAIDNVTRKLMQEGKRPISVGFFFSLGHSTIVVVASVVVYLTATVVATQLDAVKSVSGVFGTSISAFFLFAIALVNLVILRGVWQTFQEVRNGGGYTDQSLDTLLGGGIVGSDLPPALPDGFSPVAYVSDRSLVRSRLRYGNRSCPSGDLGGSCNQRVICGCDGGIPNAFHGGNDAGRYDRWHSDGWSLRMGVHEANP